MSTLATSLSASIIPAKKDGVAPAKKVWSLVDLWDDPVPNEVLLTRFYNEIMIPNVPDKEGTHTCGI